jgi:SAM-dependent methyltransferase
VLDTAPVVDGDLMINTMRAPLPERVFPSRLPRDRPPLGPDGRPATRWTDPRVAAAYAERDDETEREVLWPVLADAVRPPQPKRVSGRPDGTVLDLGCGLGGLAQYLADRHWLRVYAFDVSPTMHRIGAQRFRDAWVVRTMPDTRGRIPLRRAQCTAAVAHRLLLHLAHPCLIVGLLTEARRVLRRGAPLVVVERDTREALAATLVVSLGANDPAAWNLSDGASYVEHYRLRDGSTLSVTAWWYSPATIVECMATAGFQIEEIRVLQCPGGALLYRASAL